MKIKTWYIWLSILALLVMALEEIPDKNFRIVTCDVGQGDAILLTQGFTQVLVDGGPTEAVMSCLERYIPWFDRKLEMVVSTHPQDDHLAGLVQVLSRYKVTWLMANGVVNQARSFWDFRQEVLDNQIQVHAPSAGEEIAVGQMHFSVLWPAERSGDQAIWHDYTKQDQARVLGAFSGDLNEVSIVLRMRYDRVRVLLTGDLGSREELALLAHGVITPVEVLKVAHHGSKSSSTQAWLEALHPEWALISVGAHNSYGHPSRDTLRRLDIVGAKVLRTDTMGEIVLVSDGQRIWQGK
ncbi:hypothetical protein A3B57_00645 [Microgenomates group bacterium RIFCSPLOWO2_01_FULL_47_10]|nr:MAG: hypothetical protein A3B57_00645 [Microgenomates group bacterium RIFCSPLOWO2_01_FULL_47_10]